MARYLKMSYDSKDCLERKDVLKEGENMDKVNNLVVLKNLLHEAINGDEHGFKPDITKSEMEAIEWAIEQAEKVKQYEKALKFIVNVDGWFIGKDLEFDNEMALDLIDKTAKKALED